MSTPETAHAMKAMFLFPSASGHLNPSMPLACSLDRLECSFEYLAIKQFQPTIEDTEAEFLDRDHFLKETGIDDLVAFILGTLGEYTDPGAAQWALNFGMRSISRARLLSMLGSCPPGSFLNYF